MSLWIDIWELFFPRYCAVCGKRLSSGEECLCLKCLTFLPRTQFHLLADNEMEKALWGKVPLGRASAYLYYAKGGDVRKVLYELKYYGNPKVGHFMGRCMASELMPSGFFRGIDFIVPVPLHVRKLKQRGYNQSERLAEGISKVTGIPVLDGLLVREQYTETQTRKGSYERWMNVKDVFGCVEAERLEGKHILLVDDVFTTGATMVACADALAGIEGLRISVLTLAIAGET